MPYVNPASSLSTPSSATAEVCCRVQESVALRYRLQTSRVFCLVVQVPAMASTRGLVASQSRDTWT